MIPYAHIRRRRFLKAGIGTGADLLILPFGLALAACRNVKKLNWDATNLKATNCPEADQYIRKTYREGWTLNG